MVGNSKGKIQLYFFFYRFSSEGLSKSTGIQPFKTFLEIYLMKFLREDIRFRVHEVKAPLEFR